MPETSERISKTFFFFYVRQCNSQKPSKTDDVTFLTHVWLFNVVSREVSFWYTETKMDKISRYPSLRTMNYEIRSHLTRL